MDESSGTGPVLVNNRITIDGVVVPKWLAIVVCGVAVLGLLAMVQNSRSLDRLDRFADTTVGLPGRVKEAERRAAEAEAKAIEAYAATKACAQDIQVWIRWNVAIHTLLEQRDVPVPPLPAKETDP